jgi:hypothetical protein
MRTRFWAFVYSVAASLGTVANGHGPEAPVRKEPGWRPSAARTHARFNGRKGTFAHFGDSITVSLAYWAPLQDERKNASVALERAFKRVEAHLRPECWRDWKGPEFGNEGRMTIRWADENVAQWLKTLDPEVALISFGSNDLREMEVGEYRDRLQSVVKRCLDNGTVVILTTIPPQHGHAEKAAEFAEAARAVARELALPLVDYHAEILKRRPDDWDGADERFAAYEGYDVPTLISRDGVHPSAPQQFLNDYSEEALSRHGYNLRSALTLLAYSDVLEVLTEARITQPPTRPWHPQAPPLAPPSGDVIEVSSTDELRAAIRDAKRGATIMLADGVYPIEQTLVITSDDVTLRSASGHRERVVLDGRGTLGELLTVRACSGVTIADLTVQNVRWNGIKLDTDQNVQRVTIRNCVLHNIWQRAVKGVIVPAKDREAIRPRGCTIEYCLFTNDRPKRFEDDPADTAENFRGNYVGGIDVMFATGWTIRDNVFVGIKGRTGEARGAIFLWHDTRDCVVERNIIVDCDSGICLGNSHKPADVETHCTNVVARNNFVCRAPENGILADYTKDCAILHNTVHDPESRLARLVRIVHDNPGLRVVNNLLSGPAPRIETQAEIYIHDNVIMDLTAALVAPEEGNLRLTARASEAIDRAAVLAGVPEDIDRRNRIAPADLGAHEFAGPRFGERAPRAAEEKRP